MKLKIISGGQTGVDQAALRAAKALGIETGGTMPLGLMTEDGPKPEFVELYKMSESISPHYPVRTRLNVDESDVTLWCGPTGSRGFGATRRAAIELQKKFVVVATVAWDQQTAASIAEGLRELSVGLSGFTINVAGSRESQHPGIGEIAERDLTKLFRSLLDAINKGGKA